MLRKLAVCAGLVLALSLTGCNSTSTSAADEASVGFDASAKACAASSECTADKAAQCPMEKAASCEKAGACCDKDKDAPKN